MHEVPRLEREERAARDPRQRGGGCDEEVTANDQSGGDN